MKRVVISTVFFLKYLFWVLNNNLLLMIYWIVCHSRDGWYVFIIFWNICKTGNKWIQLFCWNQTLFVYFCVDALNSFTLPAIELIEPKKLQAVAFYLSFLSIYYFIFNKNILFLWNKSKRYESNTISCVLLVSFNFALNKRTSFSRKIVFYVITLV